MRPVIAHADELRTLTDGWELAATEPGACADADALARLQTLDWHPATVPGTAAAALPGEPAGSYDGRDWWFRTRFGAAPAADGEELVLAFAGLATVAEVYLNGAPILRSESMFAAHAVDVGAALLASNELAICCRALTPLLAGRRKPRARWRTKLVAEGGLRFYRTMLLGRAPSLPCGPPVVGPWRAVALERRRTATIEALTLRPRIEGRDGVLTIEASLRPTGGSLLEVSSAELALAGPAGTPATAGLSVSGSTLSGELRIPGVAPWWPHTHGTPNLYAATLKLTTARGAMLSYELGRVGFRALSTGEDFERDGIQLRVNGVPVFARGAVWTPLRLGSPAHPVGTPSRDALERVLRRAVDAGMNMLRIAGTACYESAEFHELCDELGILVWQDFMFANLDYPEHDEAFMAEVEREVRAVLAQLGGRPSLAVLCGGSEVAQQIAMLGLDPELANGPLYGELLPALVAQARVDAPYVRSAPLGGELPFRPDRGVANYYGVGAYLRPLTDARRAGVRFASECLAFANVPDDEALQAIDAPGGLVPHHPAWKAGVPRDAGTGWDFDDVRDHYFEALFGREPTSVRWIEVERYLELSRAVSGEVMAEVFGEWRRAASPCGGALVLWLTDLVAGAGWGLLDDRGVPKVAYHHLRRALAPVAVWTTDEGLGGIDVHVANDRSEPLDAGLRISLYRGCETLVAEHREPLLVRPHDALTDNLERLLGRFVDVGWAYRFGPPAQDLVVVSVETNSGAAVLSQGFRFPAGRPLSIDSPDRFGASATIRATDDEHHGAATVTVRTRRLLYGARLRIPGFEPADDAFCVEPGRAKEIALRPVAGSRDPASDPPAPAAAAPAGGALIALNLSGRLAIEPEGIDG